ncbi:MAG: hypothetical protein AAF567_18545 [Actinomycetota bacterium]
MAKFVFTYSGGNGMPETEAEQAEVMAKWEAWFGNLGAAVLDGGAPFSHATSISPDGSTSPTVGGLTGYSIVDAGDMDAAVAMAKGCPVLESGGSVEVSAALDM